MQFEKKIVAQQEVKNKLKDLVQQNRLSHALLFAGKEGSGALPLAIAFAQYILCEKVSRRPEASGASLFGDAQPVTTPIPDEPCGVCNSCKKAADLVHPDIHFSYPVVP